jgi:uncharacterized membrane protein
LLKNRLVKTLYILGVLVICGVLLSAAASQKSFWEDEAFTAIFAQKDISELLQVTAWDVHPPLYLFIAGQWGRLFGFDELGLRSFSILCALAALLLTYKLARDLFDERTGLIAMTLMAFTPLLVMYGHNARYYSLALLLALLVTWTALRFQSPHQFVFAILYILSSAAFLYLIFAAAVVLFAVNLWWLVRWLIQKEKRSLGVLIIWLITQALVVILYFPGVQILQNATSRFSELARVSNWLVEIIKRAGYYGFVSSVGETLSPLNPVAWLGVAVVVGVAVYAVIKAWRNLNFWLPIIFIVLIAVTNLAITFNIAVSQTWQNLTYRAFYLYPFLMIWLAVGFARMPLRWGMGSGAVLGFVFVVGIFNYYTNRQFLRPVLTVPWQAIFQRIQQESQPGALVICGFGDSSCYYYSERYGFGGIDLNTWPSLADQQYPVAWFVQSNLGRDVSTSGLPDQQAEFLQQMLQRYSQAMVYNYAPQDPSIRRLKAEFLNQEDYAYRINLHKFFNLDK